jgi:hypothetical protein
VSPRFLIVVRVCDVNPLRHEITLGRIVVNQNGATTFTEAMSKTEDARTIPVPAPAPVMTMLVEHIKTYLPDAGREDFLFLTTRGTHPLRGNFGRDVLKAGAERAGLGGRHITWPTLRHTAASLMFDAGFTIFEVQHRLGHKPDDDRRGLHPPHARTLRRRPHPPRDLHDQPTRLIQATLQHQARVKASHLSGYHVRLAETEQCTVQAAPDLFVRGELADSAALIRASRTASRPVRALGIWACLRSRQREGRG